VFRDTIFEMNHVFAESQEHHRTGFQLLSEGSYAKAREQFLKAIEKNPDWASPYLGLGQTFFFQNNPNLKEATKAFRHVVELSQSGSKAIIGSVQHRRKVEHWRKLSHAIEKRFVLLHPTHDP
jgi:tetratricopeptide (TPR) repeat protein